jgi:RNA polymerase sigma factor (TIGR02999 family)
MQEAGEVTRLLRAARKGDEHALEGVIQALYQELRRLASSYMARERGGHTLQPTALVNEACIRLLGQDANSWKDRQHFFACAAQQMRRVLLDHARARKAQKRGGDELFQVSGSEPAAPQSLTVTDMIALDEALNLLGEQDPRQCRIVELRYFAGFSEEEIADIMEIGVRTVRRDWAHAKATLARHLTRAGQAQIAAG